MLAEAETALLLMAWESVRNVGLYASGGRLLVLGLVWLSLLALYVVARVMKKRDLLGHD